MKLKLVKEGGSNHSNQYLILSGGSNGHLAHIFESGELTFAELIDIFNNVFSGKIELREKVDGFAFTVTMKDGTLYSARNKTELKNPLNLQQTIQKFSDRSPDIRNAFITSFNDMNSALQALSRAEQDEIFGNGEFFLSFEIVSPGAKNLIDYGSKAIIVMHGINIFNDNWEKQADDPEKAKKLYDYFKSKNVLNQSTYEIQGPAVLKIKDAVKANEALVEIKSDINDILDGMPVNTSLLQYVVTKIQPKLQEIAIKTGIGKVMSDVVVANLISRSKNKLGLRLTSVSDLVAHIADGAYDHVTKSQIKTFITAIGPDVDSLVDQAIMPVWILVVKAGTLLIKSLHGFISADQSSTAKELSKQLDQIVNSDFKSQLTSNNLARFTKALERLDTFNREVLGTEGLVFTYKGKLYKMTSTFGPLNQLLGLFYRSIPTSSNTKQTEESITTEADDEEPVGKIQSMTQEFNKNFKYVVYIPGSFKPPHIGHINMIRTYANKNFGTETLIKVIVSDPKKAKRLLSTGQEITANAASQALAYVLDKIGIRNVEMHVDTNPLKWIMSDITTQPENFKKTMIIIGMSSKDGSTKYNSLINSTIKYMFDNNINQKPSEQTLFIDPSVTMIEPIIGKDGNINATDLRDVLANIINIDASNEQIVKLLKPFLPRTLSDVDVLTYFKYLQLT